MTVTADRLLRGIKRRVSIAENQVLLSDDDLLELADDVIKAYIVPLLMASNGEYFVKSTDVLVTAGQAAFNLPDRAVGESLRNLKYRPDADEVQGYDLDEITQEDEDEYRGAGGDPTAYYFRNDQVIIVPPPPNSSGALELVHEQRPSNLVKLARAAKVTAINGDIVTIDTLPVTDDDDQIFQTAVECDLIRGKAGHRILAMDLAIESITDTNITFPAGAVPSDLVVGDYVSVAGTSPVLQIPDELAPLTETQVAQRAMTSSGDYEAKQQLDGDRKDETTNAQKLVEPRNRGSSRKMVNNAGLLRGRGGPRRRGRYG